MTTQKPQPKIESLDSDPAAADHAIAERALATRRWKRRRAMERSPSAAVRALLVAEMSIPSVPIVTRYSIISCVLRMSQKALEAADIAAGIARWGEGERQGLGRQAAMKTLEILRKGKGLRLARAVQLSKDEEMGILGVLTPEGRIVSREELRAQANGLL